MLPILEAGSPRPGCHHGQCYRPQASHTEERAGGSLGSLSSGTDPIQEGSALRPQSPLKGPTSCAVTYGIGCSTYEFWGTQHSDPHQGPREVVGGLIPSCSTPTPHLSPGSAGDRDTDVRSADLSHDVRGLAPTPWLCAFRPAEVGGLPAGRLE